MAALADLVFGENLLGSSFLGTELFYKVKIYTVDLRAVRDGVSLGFWDSEELPGFEGSLDELGVGSGGHGQGFLRHGFGVGACFTVLFF